MKFCPECGAPVSENNKFCPNCGSKLAQGETPTIHTIPNQPDAESAPAETDPSGTVESATPKPPVKDASGLPPAWMPLPVQPGTGSTIESRGPNPAASDSEDLAPIPTPPSFMPMPVQSTFGGSSTDRPGGFGNISDDFKMSDLGPPPPPKRRLWLWIPLGVIGFVILCCITFVVLSETVLEDTFDRWSTEIATDSTEESVIP